MRLLFKGHCIKSFPSKRTLSGGSPPPSLFTFHSKQRGGGVTPGLIVDGQFGERWSPPSGSDPWVPLDRSSVGVPCRPLVRWGPLDRGSWSIRSGQSLGTLCSRDSTARCRAVNCALSRGSRSLYDLFNIDRTPPTRSKETRSSNSSRYLPSPLCETASLDTPPDRNL